MPPRKNAVQTLVQPQRFDYEQLAVMSKSQVQAEIVKLGADWHPSESKLDLTARLLQLQGTAQPIDKLRKELSEHGIGADGEAKTDTIPRIDKRLTAEQMRKIASPYVANGMKLLLSKDGQFWEIRFECEQLRADNKIVKAKRKDSGNTMIPAGVFKNACETITTVQKFKRKEASDEVPEDYNELDDAAA